MKNATFDANEFLKSMITSHTENFSVINTGKWSVLKEFILTLCDEEVLSKFCHDNNITITHTEVHLDEL